VIFSQVAPLVLMRLDRFEKKFSSNSLLKILLKIQNKKKEIHNSFTCPLLEEWALAQCPWLVRSTAFCVVLADTTCTIHL
jgi:hypothetical protein